MSDSYLPITVIADKMFQKKNENYLMISSSLASYLGITFEEVIVLSLGIKKIQVRVFRGDLRKDEMVFGRDLYQQLSLPEKEIRFLTKYRKSNKTLYIGPIIALMTELQENEENIGPNFRSVHAFCEELHHGTSSIGGFFYVFHVKNFSQTGIEGYYFEDGSWRKDMLPLPNVIYNRIHSRKLESSSAFGSVMDTINLLQIPIFNEKFLSKWEVHKILYSEEHLQPYLPDSMLFTKDHLLLLFNKYKGVYIKPINGSQGRNIIRLYSKDYRIHAKLSSGTKNEDELSFESLSQFTEWFNKRKSKNTYLVQQEIPLLKLNERPLDFRILCHKDYQENWKITSTVARVSAEQQFVSNIARGGETMKPLKALSSLFDRQTATQQVILMKELAIETANIISQSSTGIVGELGVDIGVDHTGKLWIIEVNSKPSKNFEEQEVKIRPSAKAIIEYSTSLAFNQMLRLDEA
ncbi:YheC/YheD family protein [Cytobacillus sp. FJAT-54145]|uniref:YheC/YheD family protein n=1 Tax=Cytobacillus spartinae TaxID=3299023 RepID=A0ABW6KBW1_9BACI